ncbi:MAG: hypothetical protein KA313_04010 [Pseudarcicella sp.]|nr:hypothetical protein [Pseudarcicella sp.]MBP6410241.1 hypothetical protein [Pseudarcicella sp.]
MHYFKQFTLLLFSLFCFVQFPVFSQKIDPFWYELNCKSLPDKGFDPAKYKSFDVRVIRHAFFKGDKRYFTDTPSKDYINDAISYEETKGILDDVVFGPLKFVKDGGDLHFIIHLNAYADNKPFHKLEFKVTAFDNFYNLKSEYTRFWNPSVFDNANPISVNASFKQRFVLILRSSVNDFLGKIYNKSLNGGSPLLQVILPRLDKINKAAELQSFNAIYDKNKKILTQEGTEKWAKAITQENISLWEKLSEYKEDSETNDVKRAALLSLSTYFSIVQNEEKARFYVEKFMEIDFPYNAPPRKYNLSALTNDFVNEIFPYNYSNKNTEKLFSTAEILDKYLYITIKGTAYPKEKDKLLKEPFVGTIKIVNPEPYFYISDFENPNEFKIYLGANKGVVVYLYNGEEKVHELKALNLSKIVSTDDSRSFVVKSFGDFSNYTYTLLERKFKGNKIDFYENIFQFDLPEAKNSEDDVKNYSLKQFCWMVKQGDEKGYQPTAIGAKKAIFSYLKDCPAIEQKYKEVEAININFMDIAKQYESCQ